MPETGLSSWSPPLYARYYPRSGRGRGCRAAPGVSRILLMKTVYVSTMWSGGRPAKKWNSEMLPETTPQGTGVSFISTGTRLRVTVIGNISVEEYESGKEELEMGYGSGSRQG